MFSVLLQQEWSSQIYTKGCIASLEDWLPQNLYTVAIVFIIISVLQVSKPSPVPYFIKWERSGSAYLDNKLRFVNGTSLSQTVSFQSKLLVNLRS